MCIPPHTLVYSGHFPPPKKTKLVVSFHPNKNHQAGQRDMALKSHRSHFWQMAVSCNCYSHDVWLTHRLVHDIFLVLECSISIKLGGKRVILLYCKWAGGRNTLWRLFSSNRRGREIACPVDVSLGESAGPGWNQLRRKPGRVLAT